MPTTLFVLVNAVINAFRVIDHIVVMTQGGPDNATTLLLFYIYETGFRFWDTATAATLTVVLLVLLACLALGHFGCSAGGSTTDERRGARKSRQRRSGNHRRLDAGADLASAACSMRCGRRSIPRAYATHFDLSAPLTLQNFINAWQAAPFARYLVNTLMLVTLILAAQFVLCTLAAFAFARFTFPGRDLLSLWCCCN